MTALRSIGHCSLLFAASVFLLCPLTASSLHAEEAQKPDADTLRALVREWIDLQVQIQKEETQWQEQKAHMETTLTLLKKEKSALDETIASANKKKEEVKSERERLNEEIARATAPLEEIDKAIQQHGRRLLAVHDALPEPLKKPIAGASARVRAALFGRKGDWTIPDRLQLLVAFAADLDRVLSSVHVVKQVLAFDGSDSREVDVLYLGGAVGYYVSPDGTQSGILTRTNKGWTRTVRNDIASAVRSAIAVFRKEKAAALVALPLRVGDAEGAQEKGSSAKPGSAP